MKVRFLTLFMVAIVAASMSPLPVFAARADVDNSPLLTEDPGASGVEAQLVRKDNALSVHGTFHGVAPGETFTLWWILDDGVNFLVLNATGGISNQNGDFHFAAGLPAGTYVGDPSESRQVLFPGTLNNPREVTVIFHLIGHGPPIPGLIPEQISLFDIDPEFAAEVIFFPVP
jgi:hypothetical protein